MPKIDHDPEVIADLARIYEGSAEAHLSLAANRDELGHSAKIEWSKHEMLAASCLAISASYWSLVDSSNAVRVYRQATGLYHRMGHSYWMPLAMASGGTGQISEALFSVAESNNPTPLSVAFAMVGGEMSERIEGEDVTERLGRQWRHVGNVPVGRLGIPLDYYGRLATAMRAARMRENRQFFLAEASQFVNRAAEVLRSASHDRFHWRQLQSPILPGEPEAVAMATAMSIVSHRIFGIPITEISQTDSHGRLLLEIAEEMRAVAEGGDVLRL
jgi:hypothetical protein